MSHVTCHAGQDGQAPTPVGIQHPGGARLIRIRLVGQIRRPRSGTATHAILINEQPFPSQLDAGGPALRHIDLNPWYPERKTADGSSAEEYNEAKLAVVTYSLVRDGAAF